MHSINNNSIRQSILPAVDEELCTLEQLAYPDKTKKKFFLNT